MADTIIIGNPYTLAIASDPGLFVQARVSYTDDTSVAPILLALEETAGSGSHLPTYTKGFTPTSTGVYLITYVAGVTEAESITIGTARLTVAPIPETPEVTTGVASPTGAAGSSVVNTVINNTVGKLSIVSSSAQ